MNLLSDIIDAFKISLGKLKWMDTASAAAATEKVSITSFEYSLHP